MSETIYSVVELEYSTTSHKLPVSKRRYTRYKARSPFDYGNHMTFLRQHKDKIQFVFFIVTMESPV